MIKEFCMKETSKNPVIIAEKLMNRPETAMHGPEHHIIDGSALITALHNAGMEFDFQQALEEMNRRGEKMPGATCGQWGVCGSCTSVGAALAIVRGTGPLSDNEYYKDNMKIASESLKRIAEIGGPRCCKRNAFISISTAAGYLNKKYNTGLEISEDIVCPFSSRNPQCLKRECPFYR